MSAQPGWIRHTAGCLAAPLVAMLAAAACGSGAASSPTPRPPAAGPPASTPTVRIAEAMSPGTVDPPDAQPEKATTPPEFVQRVWTRLGGTKNSCPDEFDYHPAGGMRIFACHLRSIIGYETLHDVSGLDIFVSGPHTNAALDLRSESSFGQYNPEFVRWLADHVVPARDSVLRTASQEQYDQYVKPLASVFFFTYQKIQREPACFQREKRRYAAALERGRVPDMYVERYFFFMNEQFCSRPDDESYFFKHGFDGGYNGNVTKTCVGFWLRRSIDGTMPDFHRGLVRLLAAYDPELLRQAGRQP